MANHLRTELVLEALELAIFRRKPTNRMGSMPAGRTTSGVLRCRVQGIEKCIFQVLAAAR